MTTPAAAHAARVDWWNATATEQEKIDRSGEPEAPALFFDNAGAAWIEDDGALWTVRWNWTPAQALVLRDFITAWFEEPELDTQRSVRRLEMRLVLLDARDLLKHWRPNDPALVEALGRLEARLDWFVMDEAPRG